MLERLGPNFNMQIVEAVADERERRVWVRSVIGGGSPDYKARDSVTTMIFDEEGLCVRSWDESRERRGNE